MGAGKGSDIMSRTNVELRGDRDIVVTRTFDAPARIVFDAFTKPELVRRWWAPRSLGVSLLSCEADVRPGGHYRYVFATDPSEPMAFSGRYTDVKSPSRLVYTQVFEPTADPVAIAPGGEVIVTVTFEEHDGRTHMTSHEVYPSAEVRQAVLETGMEKGMRESMDQFDELVRELANRS
jgi:uncharacterized protein YndB with AHSA1/START domain